MFTQDFTRDFDKVLSHEEPFALARFGDGELALIDARAHQSADVWRTLGPTWLRKELVDSLRCNLPGWNVGLPPRCCIGGGIKLRATARVPLANQTFATLFIHANLHRASEIKARFDAVVVGSWYGDIRIPADGVTAPWDMDSVVTKLLEIDKPILLAAGPCANLIALRYWTRQAPDKRQTIIDVGSALDVLEGKKTRHYHDTMTTHVCEYGSRHDYQLPARRTKLIRPTSGVLPTQEIRGELPSTRRGVIEIGRHAPHAIPHGRVKRITQSRK